MTLAKGDKGNVDRKMDHESSTWSSMKLPPFSGNFNVVLYLDLWSLFLLSGPELVIFILRNLQ